MDTRSIISQKIKEMSENNNKRDISAKEAEKKMEEGYRSEPIVEQVKPKAKKPKTVTVKRQPEAEDRPTGDIKKDVPGREDRPADARKTLNESLDQMEKIMEEAPVRRKETMVISKEPESEEEKPAPEEAAAPEKEVRTTVKENPRHKGLHSVQRRRVGRPAAEPDEPEEDISQQETSFCLYEPLTGTLNELLRDVTIIGRSAEEAHIIINNQFVSRTHARVSRIGSEWYIEDLGSRNGTKVNGTKIKKGEKVNLRAGDDIELARTKIIFDIK